MTFSVPSPSSRPLLDFAGFSIYLEKKEKYRFRPAPEIKKKKQKREEMLKSRVLGLFSQNPFLEVCVCALSYEASLSLQVYPRRGANRLVLSLLSSRDGPTTTTTMTYKHSVLRLYD